MRSNHLLVASILWGAATTAPAEDLFPPAWRLLDPSCTVQEWDFDSNARPLDPDGDKWGGTKWVNPFGKPQMLKSSDGTWVDEYKGRKGTYFLRGSKVRQLDFVVGDKPDPQSEKHVWLQLTSWTPAKTTFDEPQVTVEAGNTIYGTKAIYKKDLADGWKFRAYAWVLPMCPEKEKFVIQAQADNVFVDEVVIDTMCKMRPAPEPAGASVLAVGSLALLRRRRSR